MTFFKSIKSKYILLLIVTIGFLLRINNPTIGFPILYLSKDEAIFHQSALNMIASRTPFSLGHYGPLGSYIQIPFLILAYLILFIDNKVNSVSQMAYLLATQEGYLLFVPRAISAMFGTLAILVIYKISKEIYSNRKPAIWASFLFAVSFNLVHISHMARSLSAAIFFSLLATFFAVKTVKEKIIKLKYLVLAFICSAIAFGFHQISGLVVILIFLILHFSMRFKLKNYVSSDFLLPLFSWLVLILIFNFLSIGNQFFAILSTNEDLLRLPPAQANSEQMAIFFANKIQEFSIGIFRSDGLILVAAISFLLTKKLMANLKRSFVIFIIINFFLAGVIFLPLMRYFLTAFALLPIFAGAGIFQFLRKSHFHLILAILIIILCSFNSIYWNLLLLKEPTFKQFREWLDSNVTTETPIISTSLRSVGYVPSLKAANIVREIKPGYYKRASQFIGSSYPPNVRNIIYLEELAGVKEENIDKLIQKYGVGYLVDVYYDSNDRIINQELKQNLKIVAHFSPTSRNTPKIRLPQLWHDPSVAYPIWSVNRLGPYYDVYRFNYK